MILSHPGDFVEKQCVVYEKYIRVYIDTIVFYLCSSKCHDIADNRRGLSR